MEGVEAGLVQRKMIFQRKGDVLLGGDLLDRRNNLTDRDCSALS